MSSLAVSGIVFGGALLGMILHAVLFANGRQGCS